MDVHGARCPNPYCGCEQCACAPPCTCGLHPVAHREETRWDANESALRHTVTTTYKADEGRRPASATTEPHLGAALPTVATEDVAAALDADPNQVRSQLVGYGSGQGHGGHEGHTSIRTAEHKGHAIEIRTTYEVLIDGQKLAGHFGVDQDGTTHYHGLPNYQQASAVDLVKMVIDQFPDDFPADVEGSG